MILNVDLRLRQSGMLFFSWRSLFFVVAIALLFGGCREIYTVARNPKPLVISLDEYLKSKPSARWLTVTNCRLDFLDAFTKRGHGQETIREAFIPLRPLWTNGGKTISIFLRSSDTNILLPLQELMSVQGDMAREVEVLGRYKQINPLIPREISGLMETGLDAFSREYDKLVQAGGSDLASDFSVICERRKPQLAGGIISAVIGLAILLLTTLWPERVNAERLQPPMLALPPRLPTMPPPLPKAP